VAQAVSPARLPKKTLLESPRRDACGKFFTQRNPIVGLRSACRASSIRAREKRVRVSNHDPPRTTRYRPSGGPGGLWSGAAS